MKLYYDVHEIKGARLLADVFDLESRPLPIFDYLNTTETIGVEVKIREDGLDLSRLADECTRIAEQNKIMGHAIWLWSLNDYQTHCRRRGLRLSLWILANQYVKQLLRFQSICLQANIRPHVVFTDADFIKKMQKIMSGYYAKPLQLHRKPSKKLPVIAKWLACVKGITEQSALEINEELKLHDKIAPREWFNKMTQFTEIINFIIGVTKTGKTRAPVKRLLEILEGD